MLFAFADLSASMRHFQSIPEKQSSILKILPDSEGAHGYTARRLRNSAA
jgi:hypothetical protein